MFSHDEPGSHRDWPMCSATTREAVLATKSSKGMEWHVVGAVALICTIITPKIIVFHPQGSHGGLSDVTRVAKTRMFTSSHQRYIYVCRGLSQNEFLGPT